MKSFCKYTTPVLLIVLLFSIPAFGQQREMVDDKTLSPYFFVKSDDPGVDRLPLQSTRADVDIAGVIARVRVTQVYKNTGKRPIEAVYVFPGSTRAAVFGMRMTIGERIIEANIEERRKARADYEQAKAQGKSASLLEQQRPNVFQMNVANIMPGDKIKVELDYTELLVPEDGTYEFVYPTVVGPRYSNMPREGATDRDRWVENPYLREGEPEPFTFNIDVTLNSGIPISRIACSSHETDIEYEGRSRATVALKDTKGAGTKDFILQYNLEGKQVQSGVLLYPGDDENFFLIMMEPPARVTSAVIPPREYIFVLDVSGSMNGFPLNTAKKLMRDLITQLDETDTFNVVLFAGRAAVLSEKSLPATRANIEKAMNTIDNQRGGGGTQLINALETAFALPRQEENVSRSTVIVTDGYVHCETQAFDLIRENLNKSNVFTFGIGSSVNRHLIEGMARCGRGEPLIVTGPDDAGTKADKFREYIREPVLTQIEVGFRGFRTYDVEPISVPDVLANRPVVVFGKYKGKPSGTIWISGQSGTGEYKVNLDIEPGMEEESNTALRYLWARHRIKTLSDYNNLNQDAERVKEVTSLGLTYNLLTDYTSFVAIDSVVRNQTGDSTSVVQPLPLPQGVSDLAVGRSGPGVIAMSLNYRALAEEKGLNLPAEPYIAMNRERDSVKADRALPKKMAKIAGDFSKTEAPEPAVAPKPKNGKPVTPHAYQPEGQFRNETEATSGDELVLHGEVPAGGSMMAKLLLAGIPLAIACICLVLWRRHTHRKHVNNAARGDS